MGKLRRKASRLSNQSGLGDRNGFASLTFHFRFLYTKHSLALHTHNLRSTDCLGSHNDLAPKPRLLRKASGLGSRSGSVRMKPNFCLLCSLSSRAL